MEIDLITIVGLIAASLTTIAFLPQAIMIIRTKNTRDLSLGMYVLLTCGTFMWLLYGLLSNDFPVIVANVVTFSFILTILFLKIKHK